MKIQRHNLICLLVIYSLILIVIGCAGSTVQIVKLDIKQRPDTVVYVLPIGLPEEIGIAEDWRKTGEEITTKEGETIKKGLYRYSFSEGDITILRKSLINSLVETQAFKDVVYLRNDVTDTTISDPALYIDIKIDTTDMASEFTSKCLISGKLIIKSKDDLVKYNKDINVESESLWSIGDAKNEAIKQFVIDVIGSLNEF